MLPFSVVTLWYRAPELLLGAETYGPAIDNWACGCVLGELMRHSPLMPGRDEHEQVQLIFALLGVPNEQTWPGVTSLPHVVSGAVPLRLTRPPSNPASSSSGSVLGHSASRRKRSEHAGDLREAWFDWGDDALSFLEALLWYDPHTRLTAQQALDHAYFKTRPLPKPANFMPTFPTKHAPDNNASATKAPPSPLTTQAKRSSAALAPERSSKVPYVAGQGRFA
jgi:cell division cycle 2-like protein